MPNQPIDGDRETRCARKLPRRVIDGVRLRVTTEELIRVIADWAASEPLIREVYLFGSRARGDHRSNSDVDVAVKINPNKRDGSEYGCWFYEASGLTKRLQAIIPYEIDLEWYDPVETPHVHQGIEQSSIKIYDESEI